MAKPTKKWVDPSKRLEQLGSDGHLHILPAALQGLVWALMAKWNGSPEELQLLEPHVFALAVGLCDARVPGGLAGKSHDEAATSIAAGLRDAIEKLSRPCPTAMLQVQAQRVAEALSSFPFRAQNRATKMIWLREQLPAIFEGFSQTSICNASRPHPTRPPDDNTLREWANRGRLRDLGKLRNTILAYHHGMTPDYLAQLLAGRTD